MLKIQRGWLLAVIALSLTGCSLVSSYNPNLYTCRVKNLTSSTEFIGVGKTRKLAVRQARAKCAKNSTYAWRCSMMACTAPAS